jgi:hypothetical protein
MSSHQAARPRRLATAALALLVGGFTSACTEEPPASRPPSPDARVQDARVADALSADADADAHPPDPDAGDAAPPLDMRPDAADAGEGPYCGLTDRDGDGIYDLCDVCPDVPDPLQQDTDGDGLGDACDPRPTQVDYRLGPGRISAFSGGELLDSGRARPGPRTHRLTGGGFVLELTGGM